MDKFLMCIMITYDDHDILLFLYKTSVCCNKSSLVNDNSLTMCLSFYLELFILC